jgi:carbamate kinase
VERVYWDFGKPEQKPLEVMDLDLAREGLNQEQFPAGSMGPKIRAAIEFIEAGGEEVLITAASHLKIAMLGRSGTRIRARIEKEKKP